jgi:hypothetical protein
VASTLRCGSVTGSLSRRWAALGETRRDGSS